MTALLIGTGAGLFEASLDASAAPAPLTLGEDAGVIRCPVVVDARDPGRLYAATLRSGVCRSSDRGKTWEAINKGLCYQEVWILVQHPVTGTLYAGTGPAEIFSSDSGGEAWEENEALRNLPAKADWFLHVPPFFARVRAISLAADDPDVIVGAVEEGWLVRSRDGGKTWDNLRDAMGHDCHTVALAAGLSGRVLAGSFWGVFASSDGGESFSRCEDFDASYVTDLVVHPGQPDVVYGAAATNTPREWRGPDGADTRIFRSQDAGQTWTRITAGLPTRFGGGPRAAGIHPDDPDVFLLGLTNGDVWVTTDGGKNCHQLFGGLPGGVTSLTVLPDQ